MRRVKILLMPLFLVMIAFAAGCRTLPLNGRLPGDLSAAKIASVDDGSPFAVAPDGNVVALANSGLKLFHVPSREFLPVSDRTPYRLAWSPLGYSLAAVYVKDGKNSIAIYDQHGLPMVESPIDAQLTDIAWLSENELISGGIRITGYKFGSNYKTLVFRWQPGRGLPVVTELRDSTLRPSTVANWQTRIERGPQLAVAGQTGQLLYLQPVDPPVFTPYYKLILKDLASGAEMEVASVDFKSDGGQFSADGEKIIYGDGKGTTLLYNPWSEELLRKTAADGKTPVLSPDGRSWFADGSLVDSDGRAILLAPGSVARFSRDGSRLFVRAGRDLYLVAGLKPAEDTFFVPEVAEKVDKLRSVKIQGLITPGEYRKAVEKMVQP